MEIAVVSIGTLAANPLWGEKQPVRTGHATTTLIRTHARTILVDPGLPRQALAARLGERTGLPVEAVTDVFLTSFRPECRRALPLFERAQWWLSPLEREAAAAGITAGLRAATGRGPEGDAPIEDDELREAITQEGLLLARCEAAPDHLIEGVDLYPLPGVSPGLTGLVIAEAHRTTLICGDAVPTAQHLAKRQVLANAADLEQAKESMIEATEVADVLIPGRDNVILTSADRPF